MALQLSTSCSPRLWTTPKGTSLQLDRHIGEGVLTSISALRQRANTPFPRQMAANAILQHI
ncbi:hypothetical protein FLG15_05475 [Xanthomonas phaseoli pv. dieffenbachiae]